MTTSDTTTSDTRQSPGATPLAERRLIRAAKRGDRRAEEELLRRYEPLVRRISRTSYLPGGDIDDLAQHARIGIHDAICLGRQPTRPVSRLRLDCALREARMAVNSARAAKHQPLNGARPLQGSSHDGLTIEDTFAATGRPDEAPVAKAIAREQLHGILGRVATLSTLERRALALSANDREHRDIAHALGVRPRAVNNALQRARRKLLDRTRN